MQPDGVWLIVDASLHLPIVVMLLRLGEAGRIACLDAVHTHTRCFLILSCVRGLDGVTTSCVH